jgi:Zn-finger nucleic acid-binding protein
MEVQRVEKPTDTSCACPRCRVNTKEVTLGQSTLRECPVCEGLWVDTVALHQITTDRERQTSILGDAANIIPDARLAPERVRYVPCPVCKQLMHRVNFAKCSNVIVDVCKPHGTWFDKDELHRIVKFINAGGMDVARAKEIEQLEQKRRELEAAKQRDLMTNRSQAWPIISMITEYTGKRHHAGAGRTWWVRSLIDAWGPRGFRRQGNERQKNNFLFCRRSFPIPLPNIPLP